MFLQSVFYRALDVLANPDTQELESTGQGQEAVIEA